MFDAPVSPSCNPPILQKWSEKLIPLYIKLLWPDPRLQIRVPSVFRSLNLQMRQDISYQNFPIPWWFLKHQSNYSKANAQQASCAPRLRLHQEGFVVWEDIDHCQNHPGSETFQSPHHWVGLPFNCSPLSLWWSPFCVGNSDRILDLSPPFEKWPASLHKVKWSQ